MVLHELGSLGCNATHITGGNTTRLLPKSLGNERRMKKMGPKPPLERN